MLPMSFASLLVFSLASQAAPSAASFPSVRLERVWSNLDFVRPVQVLQRPGDDRNL